MFALEKSEVKRHQECETDRNEPHRTLAAAPAGYMSVPTFLFAGGYTLGEAYGTADCDAMLQRTCTTDMHTGLVLTLKTGHQWFSLPGNPPKSRQTLSQHF